MSIVLSDFETACLQLSSNPSIATKWLTDFKDSSSALELSLQFLGMLRASLKFTLMLSFKDISRNSSVQFQLLIVVQHAYLKSFEKLDEALAVSWKRAWSTESIDAKLGLFNQISSLLQQPLNQGLRLCAMCLTAFVEAFNFRNQNDVFIPIEYHRQARKAFESFGLDYIFQATTELLARAFESSHKYLEIFHTTPNILEEEVFVHMLSVVMETSRLWGEVLGWETAENDALISSQVIPPVFISPPLGWKSTLANPGLLTAVFDTYKDLRTYIFQRINLLPATVLTPVDATLQKLRESLQMMVSISSNAGKFFENDLERLQYGNTVMSMVVLMSQNSFKLVVDPNQTEFKGDWAKEMMRKECETCVTLIHRIIGNYKLPLASQMNGFQEMFIQISDLTLYVTAQIQFQPEGLQSWFGELLVELLDVWDLLLDDSILYGSTDDLKFSPGSYLEQIRPLTQQVYVALYDGIMRVELNSSAQQSSETDIQEDLEDIEESNLNEVLRTVGIIGRISLLSSLQHTTHHTTLALESLQNLAITQQISSEILIQVLETLRLCTSFASHLLLDFVDFESLGSSAGDVSMIPSGILDVFAHVSSASVNNVSQHETLVSAFFQVLQVQGRLMESMSQILRGVQSGGNSAVARSNERLVSPLLIQLSLGFFSCYIRTYVDPDLSLYQDSIQEKCQNLFRMHGAEILSVIATLLSVSNSFLLTFGLDNDVVVAVANFLGALSYRPNIARMVVGSTEIQQLVQQYLCDPSCRLSVGGLQLIWQSVTLLCSKGNREDLIQQLSSWLLRRLEELDKRFGGPNKLLHREADELEELELSKITACMTGIARCPAAVADRNECNGDIGVHVRSLISLLIDGLPLVYSRISSKNSSVSSDPLLISYITLLRDYSEAQLNLIPSCAVISLYTSALNAINVVGERLKIATSKIHNTSRADGDEVSFQVEILLMTLQLLNHLATKDFIFSDEASAGLSTEIPVEDVVFLGLDIIIPRMQPELIKPFPELQERYFSLLSFMLSCYAEGFAKRILSAGNINSRLILSSVINHSLWGAVAVDGRVARLALGVLQSIAMYHMSSISRGGQGLYPVVGSGRDDVLVGALARLLDQIVMPTSSDLTITADRYEACSNTLMHLITCNKDRFPAMVDVVVSRFPPHNRQLLVDSFQRLVTNRGVNIDDLSRHQRVLFVQNFKDFIVEIRSIASQ